MTLRDSGPLSNLAVRLGHSADSRLLIVNCDDLGSSHSANVATFRSIVYGVATSATMMVPCPWAREAARMLKDFSVGVHLTLTCEYRGYRWRGLTNGASLRDKDGFFPATTKAALEQIDAEEARADSGPSPGSCFLGCRCHPQPATHMDVVQARTDLYEVYLDLAGGPDCRCGCSGRAGRAGSSGP